MSKMKGYKGFDKDLKCRGMQYEVGKEYEHEGEVKLCESGFHFCENPHDIFRYYPPGEGNRFAIVEADGVSAERGCGSKRAAKKLEIKSEISVFEICKIAVEVFFENFGFSKKIKSVDAKKAGDYGAARAGSGGVARAGDSGAAWAGNYGAARAGNYGAASYGAARAGGGGAAMAGYSGAAWAGNYGAAMAGYRGAAWAGNYGAARAGDEGVARAGDSGAAWAGDYGAARAGGGGAAMAGYSGAAWAGNYGAAMAGYSGVARAGDSGAAWAGSGGVAVSYKDGSSSVGAEGIAVSMGGRAKGKKGAILIFRFRDGESISFRTALVDGEKIKEDTWYCLDEDNNNIVEYKKSSKELPSNDN